ncbi:MAG: TrmO family methyltransferase [Desulfohalobiaceae bacterium]|nr:TrmO family methyltransferase [Desulfohalobiaceae bacterium]
MGNKKATQAQCRIVGWVRSHLSSRQGSPAQAGEDLPPAQIEVEEAYREALLGLRPGQSAQVLTWFHKAERGVLQCHPRGDPARPMRGVFATRSPDRPNPIGLHPVRIMGIEDLTLTVHPLEALDGTPVLDLKPLILPDKQEPAWGRDIPPETGEALSSVGRDAWLKGLVNGANGNLSLRQPGERMVITRSGSSVGRLGPGDLVSVDLTSLPGAGPEGMSFEGDLHAEVYRNQSAAGAVVHTHPPTLLALSLSNSVWRLDPDLYEATGLADKMASIPAMEPGSLELAQAVGKMAREKQAVFMHGHGLVCWGSDLNQALALSEELESLARIQLLAKR